MGQPQLSIPAAEQPAVGSLEPAPPKKQQLEAIKSWPGLSISGPGPRSLAWMAHPFSRASPAGQPPCQHGAGATFPCAEPLVASRAKGRCTSGLGCKGPGSGPRGQVPTTHVGWTNALASPAWADSVLLPLSWPIREAIGKKTFSNLDRSEAAEWLASL